MQIISSRQQFIAEHSAVFTGIRNGLSGMEGKCGGCGHNAFCKGCRAVMWHQTGRWLDSDGDCPVSDTAPFRKQSE